jgi:hypothetical protein
VEVVDIKAIVQEAVSPSPAQETAGDAPALQSPSFLARLPHLAYSLGSRIASWVSPQRAPPPPAP